MIYEYLSLAFIHQIWTFHTNINVPRRIWPFQMKYYANKFPCNYFYYILFGETIFPVWWPFLIFNASVWVFISDVINISWTYVKDFRGMVPSVVFLLSPASVSARMNVSVATSRAALLDKPPPMGTFVIITASNPGNGLPKHCNTPFT